MKEIWKQSTLVDRFEVSNLGNVRYVETGAIKYLTQHPSGYIYVHYKVNGKLKSKKLHRLVATEFCDNPENKGTVNHIDCNKQNNAASNLEWATHKENMRHAYNNGLIRRSGIHNGRCALTEEVVHNVCKDYQNGLQPKAVSDKYNITRNQATKIKSKLTWKHISSQYKF